MLSLSAISLLGGGMMLGAALLLGIKADAARAAIAAFPRHRWSGWVLSAAALFWVVQIIGHARLGRFDGLKAWLWPAFPVALGAVGFLMDELLAPRALGGLMLLAMNPVLRTARLHPSPWSAAVSLLAYAVIVAGIAWVLGPYRFRTWIGAAVAPARVGATRAALAALGAGLLWLGAFVY